MAKKKVEQPAPVDVSKLGVSGAEKEKPKTKGGGCRTNLMFGVIIVGFLIYIGSTNSANKKIEATQTAVAQASASSPTQQTDTISVTQPLAASATFTPSIETLSIEVVPSATITDTPMAAAAMPSATIQAIVVVAPIATSTPDEFAEYETAAKADLAEDGWNIQSLTLDRVGGTLNVRISYNSTSGDMTEEMINLFNKIGFFMYLNNYKWDLYPDSIALESLVSGGTSVNVTVPTNDVINFAGSPNRYPRTKFKDLLLSRLGSPSVSPSNQTGGEAATQTAVTTYYAGASGANIRTCTKTADTCSILTKLTAGVSIVSDAKVIGDEASAGNKVWYRVQYQGQTGYVYSGVMSVQSPTISSGGQSVVPVQSIPTAQAWDCSGDIYNCDSFKNRAEMQSYFAACPGDPSNLDGNGDGSYCEK